MDELTTLERLGVLLDPPAGLAPDRLRHRVMTTIAQPRPSRVQFAVPRLGWRFAGAAGLAAVLVVGFLAVQVVGFGDRAPAASAEAAQILRDAAAQAQSRSDVVPREDQFVYIDSIGRDRGPAGVAPTPAHVQTWRSVDGTRDGVVRRQHPDATGGRVELALIGCRPGMTAEQARQASTDPEAPCVPIRGYRTDLPTDVDAMLRYLYRNSQGDNPPDQQAFTTAAEMLYGEYLPRAAMTAIFGAIARIPGTRVVGDVADDAGRAGVAVALDEVQGTQNELIFDRQTHAYLGSRVVRRTDADGSKAGDVLYSTAVLAIGIVDRLGQLP